MQVFDFYKFEKNNPNTEIVYVGSNILTQKMFNSLGNRRLTTDSGDIFYFWKNKDNILFLFQDPKTLLMIPKQSNKVNKEGVGLGKKGEETYYIDGKISGMRIGAYTRLNIEQPKQYKNEYSNGVYIFKVKAYPFDFDFKRFYDKPSEYTFKVSDQEKSKANKFEMYINSIVDEKPKLNEAKTYIMNNLFMKKSLVDAFVDSQCGGEKFYKYYIYVMIIFFVFVFILSSIK